MRTLFVLTAVLILTPFARAGVRTSVYRCDEATLLAPVDANHPTVYRDIMVGTHLVIVISSDTVDEGWSGELRLSRDDANDATLSGRGFDPESWNYEGSCLEPAGGDAMVSDLVDANDVGFWYSNDVWTAIPGDWFVFDYHANQVGSVDILSHGWTPGVDPNVPVETVSIISFTHVASRDFSGDGIVNFEDLALLAHSWRSPFAPDGNSGETGFDLNADGRIEIGDLAQFTEYWLERTDCNEPAADPNDSPPAP